MTTLPIGVVRLRTAYFGLQFVSIINTYIALFAFGFAPIDTICYNVRRSRWYVGSSRAVKDIRGYELLLQLGSVVAFTTLIPLALGLWLDHWFSTSPLFILLGAILGIVASTAGVVRVALRAGQVIEKRTSLAEEETSSVVVE